MKSLLALLFLAGSLSAQIDTTLKRFFPMEIGNIWEYYTFDADGYYYYQVKVIGDTIMPNGKQYRVFWDSLQQWGSGTPRLIFFRMDDSLNVWEYEGPRASCNGEVKRFKLSIPDRTIWRDCKAPYWPSDSITNVPCLRNTFYSFIYELNLYTRIKTFCGAVIDTVNNDTSFCGSFYYLLYDLAEGIGITRIIGGGFGYWINGAIINGIKYGEIMSVKDNTINPSNFILYQNYPNPFNSVTKIKYSIKEQSFITLKVFDLLGREIATLVNEMKQPGEYEVEFSAKGGSASGGDASKYELSSGIYLYQLKSGSYTATKKFVYLK